MPKSIRLLVVFAAVLFAVCQPAIAQQRPAPWQPTPGHKQEPIWPGAIPDAQPVSGPEYAETATGKDLVAGKPWVAVEQVSRPTMTVYSPKGKDHYIGTCRFALLNPT